jgi:two-component system CheB/CheR fusion protein
LPPSNRSCGPKKNICRVPSKRWKRHAEVQTHYGTWFQMHIRPYRTLDNVIEGAVITFTDITDLCT